MSIGVRTLNIPVKFLQYAIEAAEFRLQWYLDQIKVTHESDENALPDLRNDEMVRRNVLNQLNEEYHLFTAEAEDERRKLRE